MSGTGTTAAPAPPFRLVVVLVLATGIGPFAMQVFLPALPSIQARFGVSAASAQLVFSLSAFSIAVSMLFYGPISDRFGRRPALIGGLIVYLAESVALIIDAGVDQLRLPIEVASLLVALLILAPESLTALRAGLDAG